MPHAVVAKKMKDSWVELWWHMARGNQMEYDRLKTLDVFEFYTLRDLWEKDLKVRNSQARQQPHKKK